MLRGAGAGAGLPRVAAGHALAYRDVDEHRPLKNRTMWLLSPLSWLLLAGLGACIAARRHSRRWLRASLVVALVSVLAMTPMFANGLLGWLERPPPVPPDCMASPPQVAVVLAGGVDAIPRDENDGSVLGVASR